MTVNKHGGRVTLSLTEDDAYWLPILLRGAVNNLRMRQDFDLGMQETAKHVIGIANRLAARIKRLREGT